MYAGQFLIWMLSVSQLFRNLTASRSTRVRSFRSKTMRRPFGSDPNNVSSSATFSASIRPLKVNTTSPFAALLIFSIDPQFLFPDYLCSSEGNSASNRKLLNQLFLAISRMAKLRHLAKFCTTRFFCGGCRTDNRLVVVERS